LSDDICDSEFLGIEDAKFVKKVSSNTRKDKMQMQLYMTGRLKSICKLKENQVADTTITTKISITLNKRDV
jgi:hypothetical protein